MDAQTTQTYASETTVRKRTWPLYLGIVLLGVMMVMWSVVLPVLGNLHLVHLLG